MLPKRSYTKRTKTKLSFNEQREYDNIENDIMICEEKIDGLDREIAAAATDFTKLNHLMAEKESAEMKLEHLMDRYVYLTDLVESFKSRRRITRDHRSGALSFQTASDSYIKAHIV